VVGIDVDSDAVSTINKGKVHIIEPDLDIVVKAAVSTGNLKATTTAEPADAFVIAVPTPITEGQKPDLSYIRSAAELIAPVLKKGNLVVLESTSPVGTTERLCQWLGELRPDLTFPNVKGGNSDIRVAYCPERVLPGHILQELVTNDRVVGGLSPECTKEAVCLYKSFVKGNCIETNANTAEMCKLAENAYRDINIAYANELSIICDDVGVNVWELISLANRHPRVNILRPGPGVGGHCIAIDPWFLVDSSPDNARLISKAREVNLSKTEYVLNKIVRKAERFRNPVIACLGLSFKPNIDDLRESPALEIVLRLAETAVGNLLIVEPNIGSLPEKLSSHDQVVTTTLEEAVLSADIVVVLVAHDEFMSIDKGLLYEKTVFDLVGAFQ